MNDAPAGGSIAEFLFSAKGFWAGMALLLLVPSARLLATRKADPGASHGRWPARLYLLFAALFLSLAGLEWYFRNHFMESHGYVWTHATARWNETYWKPINSLGFRDAEHTPETLAGKKLLVVVGDSFAAGHGVEDVKDRFSDVLGRRLGEGWAVANIAERGANTPQEFDILERYPHRPDAVLLSYFLNDIESAAEKLALTRVFKAKEPEGILKALVDRSSFANFLYWRFSLWLTATPYDHFRGYLPSLFDHPEVWRLHKAELGRFADYAREREIPLYVVVFPNLLDAEGSRPMTGKVADAFRERDVPVLDLADVLTGRGPSGLIVAPADAHPNAAVQREVGNLLYDRFFTAPPAGGATR